MSDVIFLVSNHFSAHSFGFLYFISFWSCKLFLVIQKEHEKLQKFYYKIFGNGDDFAPFLWVCYIISLSA